MSKVSVTVIAPLLTNFFHCSHCEQLFDHSGIGRKMHQEVLDQYPEDVKQEAAQLANLVFDLDHEYSDRINLRVMDPQSLPGFFLSIRHWVRRYPTFIIEGRKAHVGADRKAIDRILQDTLRENPAAGTTFSRSKSHDRVT